MKNALIAILLCGVAVAACDASRKDAEASHGTTISIDADSDTGKAAISTGKEDVAIRADMESGELEMQLPGGLGGKIKLPDGLQPDTKFDLDGIGRYPGARITSVNINAGRDGEAKQAVVLLGFSAPGTADQVADWYEQALTAKGRPVSRDGATITSKTEDGDPMVLAIRDGEGGQARGEIRITDRKG